MKNWQERFSADLRAAMAKADVGLGGLEWATAVVDHSYGDKVGMAFYDAPAALCERAAAFFATWASRYLTPHCTYRAQYRVEPKRVEMRRTHYSNGAKTWVQGWDIPLAPAWHAKRGLVALRTDLAVVVPFVYYSGSD